MLATLPAKEQMAFSDRLTETSTISILSRLSESGLLAKERVVVIGLDAIRDRFGEHWRTKRELVWDAAERCLKRKLSTDALWARISDTDFIISSGEESGGCRSVGLNVLRELFDFFLGAQRFSDMKIALVTSLADGEIICRALDPREIAAGDGASAAPASAPNDLTFLTSAGQTLRLGFEREQIVNLKNGVPIATRLSAFMTDQETGLRVSDRWPELVSGSALAAISAATIDAVSAQYCKSQIGVLASYSIHAVLACNNRIAMVRKLEGIKSDAAKPIIIELTDIDRGTPQSRVLEAVASLAPHCRKVLARTSLERPPLELLKGCRLSGLSVDCRHLQEDTREFMLALSTFVERSKSAAPLVFALGLNNAAACDLAAAVGVTHGARLAEAAHN